MTILGMLVFVDNTIVEDEGSRRGKGFLDGVARIKMKRQASETWSRANRSERRVAGCDGFGLESQE
jgi:hypothetical protein